MDVTIEKLVYGGDGLARNNGQVLFVPGVLPGERVEIAPQPKRAGIQRAAVSAILDPSPQRQPAPCPYFGQCGGCHYQHAPYPSQLDFKLAILRETLQRIGKITPPETIDIISGPEFGYRNRAQFHLDSTAIGFHKPDSRDLVAVDRCALLSPRLAEAYQALRDMMPDRRFPAFVRSIELFTNETEVQLNVLDSSKPVARVFFDWCAKQIPGYTAGAIRYDGFRVSYGAFYQVNRFLVHRLVETALDGAAGESALDLYAGVGLFTLPLAGRFAKVTAVESGNSAWRDLVHNSEGKPVNAVHAPAERYLTEQRGKFDFVIADPPRAGLGKHVTGVLLEARPPRLALVSCDPSTLARDLAALAPAFEIRRMTMIDLFPQTYHIETIVHLEARA